MICAIYEFVIIETTYSRDNKHFTSSFKTFQKVPKNCRKKNKCKLILRKLLNKKFLPIQVIDKSLLKFNLFKLIE